MAKIRNSKKLTDIHKEAVKEFNDIFNAVEDERKQSLGDRRFCSISGAQWEGNLGTQFENKPKFEVNKINLSVMRIFNEYRNNKFTADFVAKDGVKDDKLADTCDGLHRSDEQDSAADEAYDNAFDEGTTGGFGAWRLRTVYVDEYDDENDEQRIVFEPIYDADKSVYFDLDSKRQDKRDAKRGFVSASMTKDAYREEWDDEPDGWSDEFTDYNYDWTTDDMVIVMEYYRVEMVKKTVFTYETIDGTEERYTDEDFEGEEGMAFEAELHAIGTKYISEKNVKTQKVHKYILSGGKVLEDCGYIAGSQIPIVPFYGKRWYIDNIERCMGHVRLAKDSQRLANMQRSKLAEFSALSTVSKPIFNKAQIIGHEKIWSDDNVENFAYLTINPNIGEDGSILPAGPVAYTKAPEVPQAMAALLQIVEQDLRDLLGNDEQGEQFQANMSGKAVELIQGKLDMQKFIYMSNMKKAKQRSGEIWLGMARDIIVEVGRKMKVVNSDDESDSIEMNSPALDPETNEQIYDNDLSKANFNVSVDVGPSSQSKREATVRSLMGIIQASSDPETIRVLTSMAIVNMEGEGMSDVRKYFRGKLVREGVLKPTEKEQKEMDEESANQKPDANEEYLKAAALNEEAKAGKAQADTTLSLAKAQKTGAETEETLASIDRDDEKLALEIAKTIGDK